MSPTGFRNQYDGIQADVSFATGLACPADDKRTKDSFKDECDINYIMARYDRTGYLPELAARQPQYGDFTDVPTYLEAMNTVKVAETAFMGLPAAVRAECDNNPAVFLEKVQDPAWALKHELALPVKAAPQAAAEESAPASAGAGEQ